MLCKPVHWCTQQHTGIPINICIHNFKPMLSIMLRSYCVKYTPQVTAPLPTPSSSLASGGGEVYICPTCGRPDDGTPMIACDKCDTDIWYHM